MTVPPGLVVDASVAVKWHLTEESHTERAKLLLAAFREGRTKFAAPALIRYELANALERAVRYDRIDREDATLAFNSFLALSFHSLTDEDALVTSAFRLARSTGASVYDAVYVVHAEAINYDLVTADEELARQMSSYNVRVHLLSELDLS